MRRFGSGMGMFLATVVTLVGAATAFAGDDRIVYTCQDTHSRDICVLDPDAGSPINLTQTNAASEQSGSFSPDGGRIAFYADYGATSWDLYVTLASGTGTAENISQTNDRWEGSRPASWSADGSTLAYETTYISNAPPDLGSDVLVSPATGTLAPRSFGSTQNSENAPQFSPDGTKIAYASRGGSGVNGIMVGPADGSSPRPCFPARRSAFARSGPPTAAGSSP